MKKTILKKSIGKRVASSVLILASLFSLSSYAGEPSKLIIDAVNSPERPAHETTRDLHRKPAEVLQLLGVKPGMRVIDLSSGGGYYTDILSRIVGDKGEVIAHNAPFVINRFPQFLDNPDQGWLPRLKNKQWKTNVTKLVGELDTMSLPVQIDAAMMVLFYHDIVWQKVDREMMNRHLFNALKPGGSFLIIDHSAKAGTGIQDVESLHRIDKQFIIEEVTAAGFKLETDSDLLSHPEDKRDYIFTRDARTKRDQTDRMVLKFIKPKT